MAILNTNLNSQNTQDTGLFRHCGTALLSACCLPCVQPRLQIQTEIQLRLAKLISRLPEPRPPLHIPRSLLLWGNNTDHWSPEVKYQPKWKNLWWTAMLQDGCCLLLTSEQFILWSMWTFPQSISSIWWLSNIKRLTVDRSRLTGLHVLHVVSCIQIDSCLNSQWIWFLKLMADISVCNHQGYYA